MNERIKELIAIAFDSAEYPADQQYRIEPNSAFCEKFAELLIKEWAQIKVRDSMNNLDYVRAMDAHYEQKWAHRFD